MAQPDLAPISDILAPNPAIPILIMSVQALRAALERDTCTMTVMADGTGVLLDLRNESMLTFNNTGTFMFGRLKEGDDLGTIVAQVISAYDVDESTALADVSSFVAQLQQALGLDTSSE
jgi:hypothetical protein